MVLPLPPGLNPAALVALLLALAVLAAFAGLHRTLSQTHQLEAQIQHRFGPGLGVSRANVSSGPGLAATLNARLSQTTLAERMQQDLNLANIQLKVAEYLALRAGLVLAALILGTIVSGQMLGGGLLGLVAWWAPQLYVHRRQDARIRAFNDQLLDVVNLLVSSLRAGYGLRHALVVVVDEMPEPAASEFGRVSTETRLGYSLEDALRHLTERNRSDDLEMIVTAINIQTEVGGSMADTLDAISITVRDRIRINGEIRVLTAQQRLSGNMLAGLPFVLGTALMLHQSQLHDGTLPARLDHAHPRRHRDPGRDRLYHYATHA